MIAFLEFAHGTPMYDRVLPLRNRILREPIGVPFTEADYESERDHRHFALVDGDEPLACLIAAPRGVARYQLRQMAVDERRRGRGLGRMLIERVEAALAEPGPVEPGPVELMLHARSSVVGFYEKLGYAVVGEEFIEVTLPHREMVKRLT